MTRRTQAHRIVDLLALNGIKHVFGIPGTHNIELFDALAEHPEISPVLITDEQSAGFIGDGYARSSGRMAALALVPGAGLSHALSGIAEAYLDQIPLLVLACGVRGDSGKRFQLHDVDQLAMVKPVSKWSVAIRDWGRLDEIIGSAIRIANEHPKGPVVIEMPAEGLLLSNPPSLEQEALPVLSTLATQLSEREKAQFQSLLSGADRIGIYVGNIGLSSTHDSRKIVTLANHLDAWVWSTVTAKGIFPETSPRFVWNILGAGAPSEFREIEEQVDLWIAFGGRFGEVATASYGFAPKKPLVHVDVDQASLGANHSESLSIHMNAWDVIDYILERVPPRQSTNSQMMLECAKSKYEATRKKEVEVAGKISPRRLMKSIQAVFPKDTVYVADSGNGLFHAMENLKLDHPRCFLAPVDYSCMGYSVPAGIGAKIADPARTVVVFPGDGAFLMTGLELLSARASGFSPIVFVLKDGELSQISQFQKASVVRTTLSELPAYDLSKIAAAVGYEFVSLSSDTDLSGVMIELLSRSQKGESILVEVPVDYSIKTAFTKGVIATNFKRFPWREKLSLANRVIGRNFSGLFTS